MGVVPPRPGDSAGWSHCAVCQNSEQHWFDERMAERCGACGSYRHDNQVPFVPDEHSAIARDWRILRWRVWRGEFADDRQREEVADRA